MSNKFKQQNAAGDRGSAGAHNPGQASATLAPVTTPEAPPPAAAPEPKPPPTYSRTVRYVDGRLGDLERLAQDAIKLEARANGLGVKQFIRAPLKVISVKQVEAGKNPDGSAQVLTERLCQFVVTAEVTHLEPERWVRLTTASGPAAVEILTTQAGKILKLEQHHPEDLRQIAAGFAERALSECAGP